MSIEREGGFLPPSHFPRCSIPKVFSGFFDSLRRRSGGNRAFVPVLSRAAVAVGVSGLFMETHPDPEHAKSDGPNSVPLARMRELLTSLVAIDRTVKAMPMLEDTF